MSAIGPHQRARLEPWLRVAAVAIRTYPQDPNDELSTWNVEIHNGYGAIGAVVAVCPDELHAELIAAGIWSLWAHLPEEGS